MAKKEHLGKSSADKQAEVPGQNAKENLQQDQRMWNSEQLFGDQREILITHGDDVYRLRKTRFGKLILHK